MRVRILLPTEHLHLQHMEESEAMLDLKDTGVKPEMAYLAVKAAKFLLEPYVYKEAKDRIVKAIPDR